MVDTPQTPLTIAGNDWHFVNGKWQDGQGESLIVPKELLRSDGYSLQGHHYAFAKNICLRDVRIRFEFRLMPHTDIGLILRATDESHFYLLHFPNCGQASRSQHFWAALSKMDGSGYLRRIKMEMVRRVPSNSGLWLCADVTLSGNKISVCIDKNGRFEAQDETYCGPGHIGIHCFSCGGFSQPEIRNVTIEAQPAASSVWNDKVRQPKNWFCPCPDTAYGNWQKPLDLVCLPDGELLLNYVAVDQATEKWTGLLSRSADGGRTWSSPETPDILQVNDEWYPSRVHMTPGQRLICLIPTDNDYLTAESKDAGRTWSKPVPVAIGPAPAQLGELILGPQAFLNLADGSMVLFCYGHIDSKYSDLFSSANSVADQTWGSGHAQAFTCRSTDDGHTWSSLANIDNPGCDAQGKQYEGNLDLTEICGVQLSNGRIMALIRPVYSPWMWETWSQDGGTTWGPCVRGPFPGYATPNMLRTASGAILVAHRLPGLTIHCSFDDGRSWDQGTMIDSAVWVMGTMAEVEPNLVLYVYWDSFESLMRAQFIRVLPSRIEPLGAG